jgi:hypothetical protein
MTVPRSTTGAARRRVEHRNHVWSYEFIEDHGKILKILPIVDECTREYLTIEIERSLTAKEVVETSVYSFELRGAPEFLRLDNGLEFIARAVKD